ncbi:MAG: hypothetical protein H6608_08565 [Flavobacteriales bacterium]|nr:hypothetical protein [Flavobacteriales bacterium]
MTLLEINSSNLFIDILQFTVPTLIVFLVTYLSLKKFLDEDYKRRQLELKSKLADELTPVKLQAYERLTILLERLKPDNLVLRLANTNINATEFRYLLIQQINDEFNHNVSQQIYVSDQAWTLIKAIRENTINQINDAYAGLREDARGTELGKNFLQLVVERNDQSAQQAIQFLKKEIDIVFGI